VLIKQAMLKKAYTLKMG